MMELLEISSVVVTLMFIFIKTHPTLYFEGIHFIIINYIYTSAKNKAYAKWCINLVFLENYRDIHLSPNAGAKVPQIENVFMRN